MYMNEIVSGSTDIREDENRAGVDNSLLGGSGSTYGTR